MTFLPKPILKRMFPMNCVEGAPDGFKITLINAIGSILIDEYLGVKVNGEEVPIKEIKITTRDKTIELKNAQDAIGASIPVGGVLVITAKYNVTRGQRYIFSIIIGTKKPIKMEIERNVE